MSELIDLIYCDELLGGASSDAQPPLMTRSSAHSHCFSTLSLNFSLFKVHCLMRMSSEALVAEGNRATSSVFRLSLLAAVDFCTCWTLFVGPIQKIHNGSDELSAAYKSCSKCSGNGLLFRGFFASPSFPLSFLFDKAETISVCIFSLSPFLYNIGRATNVKGLRNGWASANRSGISSKSAKHKKLSAYHSGIGSSD